VQHSILGGVRTWRPHFIMANARAPATLGRASCESSSKLIAVVLVINRTSTSNTGSIAAAPVAAGAAVELLRPSELFSGCVFARCRVNHLGER
jgi:hypothetical protein